MVRRRPPAPHRQRGRRSLRHPGSARRRVETGSLRLGAAAPDGGTVREPGGGGARSEGRGRGIHVSFVHDDPDWSDILAIVADTTERQILDGREGLLGDPHPVGAPGAGLRPVVQERHVAVEQDPPAVHRQSPFEAATSASPGRGSRLRGLDLGFGGSEPLAVGVRTPAPRGSTSSRSGFGPLRARRRPRGERGRDPGEGVGPLRRVGVGTPAFVRSPIRPSGSERRTRGPQVRSHRVGTPAAPSTRRSDGSSTLRRSDGSPARGRGRLLRGPGPDPSGSRRRVARGVPSDGPVGPPAPAGRRVGFVARSRDEDRSG